MNATIDDVVSRSAWDEFLERARPDIGFKQSSWWADFLGTCNWGHFGVVLNDDAGEIVGGASVLKKRFASGRCWYYLPQGPVLPADEAEGAAAFEAILSHIDERRRTETRTVSHLRIEPHWKTRPAFVQGCRETRSWLEPRDTLCVDLGGSEDAILAQMKPKGRYNIGVARRKGCRIVEDTSPQGLSDFLRIYHETIERHDLGTYSTNYFGRLLDQLVVLNRGTLLFAEYQGMRVATDLVIYFGDTASYKYGGSVPEHRNVMAPYLLHYEAMLRAKSRGHRWYDFCGIAKGDDPDDRWAGFSAFKRKFGGFERNFVPALDFVFNQEAYDEYRRQA